MCCELEQISALNRYHNQGTDVRDCGFWEGVGVSGGTRGREGQQARGTKQPHQKYFMTNEHESEYAEVCWMSQTYRSVSQQSFASLAAILFWY